MGEESPANPETAASTSHEVAELNERLARIEALLQNDILKNCNKMSNHIDFIERIYDYIKFPLFYISEKMRFVTSKQRIPIEHSSHESEPAE